MHQLQNVALFVGVAATVTMTAFEHSNTMQLVKYSSSGRTNIEIMDWLHLGVPASRHRE